MIIVRLLSPEPVGWFCHHQLYSGVGADIVMESIATVEDCGSVYPPPRLSQSGVAVEKVPFCQKSWNLGDRKCLPKRRSSFVGPSIEKFFRHFSGESVFQQPRLFSTVARSEERRVGKE